MPAQDALEDVSLEIEQEVFRFWTKVRVKRSMDTFSTAEFSAPFEASRKEFREIFRPFKFQSVVIKEGDNRLFTGRVVGINPSVAPDRKEVTVTAYALPAVLHDCTAPASLLPLEFKKLKLQAIAGILCAPFGVNVDFRGEDGAAFDKVKLDASKKLFEFLKDLAEHRNFIFTDNTIGDLLCWRSVKPGTPVARLRDDEQPVTKVEPSYNPQDYFSEITGFAPAKRGRKGSKFTEKNKWLPNVLRPFCFHPDKIEKGDLPGTVRMKLARMFADMVSFDIDVATWKQPDGEVWRPNTTVTLLAPDAMVYRETELLVRDVETVIEKDSRSAQLNLVLPGVFDAEIPETLPWDE
jgi:prophage tail gpP-like protein